MLSLNESVAKTPTLLHYGPSKTERVGLLLTLDEQLGKYLKLRKLFIYFSGTSISA